MRVAANPAEAVLCGYRVTGNGLSANVSRIVSMRSVSTTDLARHDNAIAGAPFGWLDMIRTLKTMN